MMCLCSTFTCHTSPFQDGSNGEDGGSRTKCAGEGTGSVDVPSTICAQGNVWFAPHVAAEDIWCSGCLVCFGGQDVGEHAEELQQGEKT